VVKLDNITPYWWIDPITTIASIPFALIGFAITWWQLVKTRDAANAAKAAALRATAQFSRMTLVSALPQLRQIDDEMDCAIREQSAEALRFWISRWKWEASDTRGHLSETIKEEARIMRAIQSSLTAASDLGRAMHATAPDQLAAVTDDLMRSVDKITAELGTLAAKKALETDGAANG
jgi:hypothetical protein